MIKRERFLIAMSTLLLAVISSALFAQDDIDAHRSCDNCGMDRKAYGYSRMLLRYDDGTEKGTCSLSCSVIELKASKERTVKALLVADRDTRELINAETAVWVMGGKKRGVMSDHPTWAFHSKTGAEAFLKENGGKVVTWAEALSVAREELLPKQ